MRWIEFEMITAQTLATILGISCLETDDNRRTQDEANTTCPYIEMQIDLRRVWWGKGCGGFKGAKGATTPGPALLVTQKGPSTWEKIEKNS